MKSHVTWTLWINGSLRHKRCKPVESDCICLALAQPASQAIVLIDERAGRAIANELGIQVAGTAAVIGFAKRHGLIESAKARFERLHDTDFRISKEVIQIAVKRRLHLTGRNPQYKTTARAKTNQCGWSRRFDCVNKRLHVRFQLTDVADMSLGSRSAMASNIKRIDMKTSYS